MSIPPNDPCRTIVLVGLSRMDVLLDLLAQHLYLLSNEGNVNKL